MAKARYKKKSGEGKRKWNQFIIFVISATMLLSGFMYLGSRNGSVPERETPEIHVETYGIEEFSRGTILRVTEVIPEVVVIPRDKCIGYYTLTSIHNLSIQGLEVKQPEVSNPSIYPEGNYICGDWIIFRFGTVEGDNNSLDKLTVDLNGILSDYSLHGSYMGTLLQNVTGMGSMEVVGSINTVEGDYVTASLFQKIKDNTVEDIIGFEEGRVQVGPNISADVVNVTGITINGEISSDINFDYVRDRINTDDISLNPPSIIINGTLNNETLDRLRDLDGVRIEAGGDATAIFFNASLGNISQILNEGNLTYSLQKGDILLRVPITSNTSFIEGLLSESNVRNIEFKKTGYILIAPMIIIDNQVVAMENNDRFNAILYMDSEVGDSINVSISTIKLGDRIIALQAFQID